MLAILRRTVAAGFSNGDTKLQNSGTRSGAVLAQAGNWYNSARSKSDSRWPVRNAWREEGPDTIERGDG
jgi:hypothetical protein